MTTTRFSKLLHLCLGTLLYALISPQSLPGAPNLPVVFYGQVQVNSVNALSGTSVSAWVAGVKVAETIVVFENGLSVYSLKILGDDPDTTDREGGIDGDSVSFKIDGFDAQQAGFWESGEVSILDLSVTPPPAAPIALSQTLTLLEDTSLSIQLQATDINQQQLQFTVQQTPEHGTLRGDAPHMTYMPNQNFNGTDSFTFVASDGTNESNLAIVTLRVDPVPDPPSLEPISDLVVDENTTLDITISGSDPDNNPLTLTLSELPGFAEFTDRGFGQGRLVLSPGFNDAGDFGPFEITLFDGNFSASQSFVIQVIDFSGPPIADSQIVSSNEDESVEIVLSAVDPDGDPISYRIDAPPSHGDITGTPPNIIYAPETDFNGSDSFTFIASDATGDSDTATVTVDVVPVPDVPTVTVPAGLSVNEGDVASLAFTGTDADGDPVALTMQGLPGFASFSDNGNNTGTLTVAPGFDNAGIYSGITVTVNDGTLASTSSLELTILDATPMPVALFVPSKAINAASLENGARIVDFSSQCSGCSAPFPERAIDNENRTNWRTENGANTDQWIKVQLAGVGPSIIHRVILRGRGDSSGMKDFDIRVSTTGTENGDFVTVFLGTVPQDNRSHEYFFDPVQAQYVQLFIHNNWGGSRGISVFDFDAWSRGRQGGIVSMREGPVAQVLDYSSRRSSSQSPDQMLDASTTSVWRSAAGQAVDQFATIELGGALSYTLDRVRLQADLNSEALREFEVLVSNTTPDDGEFFSIVSDSLVNDGTLQEFNFAPIQARYIKLLAKNNHGSNCCIRINQFRVLTSDGANVARLEGVGAFVLDYSSRAGTNQSETNAIDLADNTVWQTAAGQVTNQFITLRLLEGSPYLIDTVKLKAPGINDNPKDFDIYISTTGTDESDFVRVLGGQMARVAAAQWFRFKPVSAKYVKLVLLNNHGNTSQIRLGDFQIYSTSLGGAEVAFNDMSFHQRGEIVEWQWQFGDGEVSNEQHPVHLYQSPGSYTVALTVTDEAGQTSTAFQDYRVLEPPSVDFTWTPEIPNEGDRVNFSDLSSDSDGKLLTWNWWISDYGNSVQQNTSAIIRDSGITPVTLTVTDSQLLTSSITRQLTANNVAPRSTTGADHVTVWGQSIRLDGATYDPGSTDTATLVCEWDFGDGQTATINACNTSSKPDINHSYDLPGNYTATLTVTDKDGGSGSDTIQVAVNKRDSGVLNYIALQIDPTNAQVRSALIDLHDWSTIIEGRDLNFDIDGNVQQTTTNDQGIASVRTPIPDDLNFNLSTQFAGDFLYNASNASDSLTVLDSKPVGDIVFIIDESSSMGNDQQEVTENLSNISVQLNQTLDVQLGVVGFGAFFGHFGLSEKGPGHIHSVLTKDLTQLNDALESLDISGGLEPGFNATIVAMSDAMGFREDSGVCAILISDEDSDVYTEVPDTREQAVAALKDRDAVFIGLVDPDDTVTNSGETPNSSYDYGPDPGSLAAETDGQIFNILEFRANPISVLPNVMDACVKRIIAKLPPDLEVSVSDSVTEASPGSTLSYEIAVTNTGQQTATGITLSNTLPDFVSIISVSDQGNENAGVITWPVFDLAQGETAKRTFTVTVIDALPVEAEQLINEVTVSDDGLNGEDPTPQNNLSSDIDGLIAAPQLGLNKTDNGVTVSVAEKLQYGLTASNTGNRSAANTQIIESIPRFTVFDAAQSSVGWSCGNGTTAGSECVFDVGTLNAGDSLTLLFAVTVEQAVPANVDTIENSALVQASNSDSVAAFESTPIFRSNAPPELVVGSDQVAVEGDVVTIQASFTDLDSADTHTATVTWGDDSGETTATIDEANGTGSVIAQHQYLDNGNYEVVVAVQDHRGLATDDTILVTVINAAPAVDAVTDQEVSVAETLTIDAVFTDQGVLDTHTAVVDWGDGEFRSADVTQSNGSGTASASYSYSTAGTYAITVTVTDKDGDSGSDQANITVNSVATQTIFNLTARAKFRKVDIVWTPVADADGYNVYRSTSEGGPYELIAANHITDYAVYADLGLINDVTYYYVVRSVTNGTESLNSNEVSATPRARKRI